MLPSEKSEQLERSFGIRHPEKALNGALRRHDGSEVTPFQQARARDKLLWLSRERDVSLVDAAIVMLMGGARIEAIAAAVFTPPNRPGKIEEARVHTSRWVRARLAQMREQRRGWAHRERLIELSHESLNLWHHV